MRKKIFALMVAVLLVSVVPSVSFAGQETPGDDSSCTWKWVTEWGWVGNQWVIVGGSYKCI